MIYYLAALVTIILDQITKWLIIENMNVGDSIPIIENLFYITSLRNPGAAFGILQGQRTFFLIITTAVIVFLIYLIQTRPKNMKLYGYSLALVLGGAIGNFIDRLFRNGEVVDFINVYIFSYDFPVFNIADIALNIGIGLMLIHIIIEEGNPNTDK